MFNRIKYILFIFIISCLFTNTSYQGLLIPSSLYMLLSSNESYSLDKAIIFSNSNHPQIDDLEYNKLNNISSSLIMFPQDINVGSFEYSYKIADYKMESNIQINNYGDFLDSESNYTFSSQDFILQNRISHKINNQFYISGAIKYINSNIDNYTSSALASKLNFHYHFQKPFNNGVLLHLFFNNYGIVLDTYTGYKDTLPNSYGALVMFSPVHIDALVSCQYELFNNYHIFTLHSEIFIFQNSSLLLSYTSLANNLYLEDFNKDFFTGISLGFSTQHQNYGLNIGIQNLGVTGIISIISISKSLN